MVQAVSRSLPTAGVPSLGQDHSLWVLWWTNLNLGKFFSGFRQFFPATISPHSSHFISFHPPLWWCGVGDRTDEHNPWVIIYVGLYDLQYPYLQFTDHNYLGASSQSSLDTALKLNLWRYSPDEPRPTEILLPDGNTGDLVVNKALSLNLNFSFINGFRIFSYQVAI